MKKLLLLGKAKTIEEIVAYAKSQGVYTILTATEDEEHCPTKKLVDEAWNLSTGDMDALEKKCVAEGVNAVFCGTSEFNIEKMMELCSRLNLPCYCDPEPFSFSRDKMKFRELCESVGAPMAKFFKVTKEFKRDDLEAVEYPVVVKPIDRNGNRGISFCDNEEELKKAYLYALSVSNSEKIVVEKKLQGREFYAFYALADGEPALVSFEAMCMQSGYPGNCYVYETSATIEKDHFLQELNPVLINVFKHVGCRDGICWAEFMQDTDGHFYILEMGHRFTGEMAFLAYPKSKGFDVVKWMTDIALGVKHTKQDLPDVINNETGYDSQLFAIWTTKDATIKEINGIDKIKGIPNVFINLTIQPGDYTEQYRHVGTIIFSTQTREETSRMIDYINNNLEIIDECGDNIFIKYTDFNSMKEI